MNMDVDVNFTINDVGLKWKSKAEIYAVLTTELNLYLPLNEIALKNLYDS